MTTQDHISRESMKDLRRARHQRNYRECIVWVPEKDLSIARDLCAAGPRPFDTLRFQK